MTLALVAALFGVLLGTIMSAASRRQKRARLHARAEAMVEAAMVDAERVVTSSQGACEAQVMRLRQKRAQEHTRATQQMTDHDMELGQREELAALRQADLERYEADINDQAAKLLRQEAACQRALGQARALGPHLLEALSTRAEQSPQDAVQERVAVWLESAQMHAQMDGRAHESKSADNAERAARRLLTMAMDRYSGVGHLERIQNTFQLNQHPRLGPLTDTASPMHAAFINATGCELWFDGEASTLSLRGDDPLGRELGRRLLTQIEARPHCTVAAVTLHAAKIRKALVQEVQRKGQEAFRILGLTAAHPEVMDLVGRLQFRLSYSQNQWKHAVEVAHLCGMVAAELGCDVNLAKRGGLLHDIGKALTHEREGSHAVIGAEVARRCHEPESVCNAIGAHHADEKPTSLLAYIVAACDAVSGARPGARRDTVTQYLSHIEDLQRIAKKIPAVRRVDIMQAGREVRVVVNGAARGDVDPSDVPQGPAVEDTALFPLAQDIARSIEEELTFAGQIRVTVIRESRAVSIAY